MWEVYAESVGIIGYVFGRNKAEAIRMAVRSWPWIDSFTVVHCGGDYESA